LTELSKKNKGQGKLFLNSDFSQRIEEEPEESVMWRLSLFFLKFDFKRLFEIEKKNKKKETPR